MIDYYIDATWDNRDHTDDTQPNSPGYDDGNRFNDLFYGYFLVGSGNANWGAGSTHKDGDPSGSCGIYLHGLPAASAADYAPPPNAYPYLTDNGYYGATMSLTAADDLPYCTARAICCSARR